VTRKFKKKGVKKKGVSYWKKKAWGIFSRYIRLRDALETTGTKTRLRCCTCGKIYPAFGVGCVQAGHFIPGRGHNLLFREQGVHGQCYNCNITLKGNWVEYERFMVGKYGRDITEEEKKAKYAKVKYTAAEMEELYYKYKMMFEELDALKGGE